MDRIPGCTRHRCSLPGQAELGRARWLCVCLLLLLSLPCAAAELSLQLSPLQSNDGVAHLTWEAPGDALVTLQQSSTPDFRQAKQLYRGNDTGSTITGLPDGTYYFRVGTAAARWSDPVRLEVSHHSLQRAFAFFALGLVVFLGTLGLVVYGARRQGKTS